MAEDESILMRHASPKATVEVPSGFMLVTSFEEPLEGTGLPLLVSIFVIKKPTIFEYQSLALELAEQGMVIRDKQGIPYAFDLKLDPLPAFSVRLQEVLAAVINNESIGDEFAHISQEYLLHSN
jgi:hypothetical protein